MTTDSSSSTQQILAAVWSETLQRQEPIRAADDFFELGGDSVMMMVMLFKVNHVLGVELLPEDLFVSPSLCALAQRIDELRQGTEATVTMLHTDSGEV